MQTQLDLIIPGLFNLPVETLDPVFLKTRLPELNHFLQYAGIKTNQLHDFEPILADCMGWLEYPALPFAQAYVEPDSSDRHSYLLFKPIHLKVDMHSAIVIPLEDNQSNNADFSILINDLKDYFKVDCDIHSVPGGYWLMRLKQCQPPQHYPHYLSVIGRKADPYTEQSRVKLPWYKLMNEMQMYLYQHDINQNRLETGLLAINSLWFWGAGSLPEVSRNEFQWVCDDELLTRFAGVSGLEVGNIVNLQAQVFDRHSVVIDLSLLEALKIDPGANLEGLLERIEVQIFKPLVRAVCTQRCSLRLRAGSQYDYHLNPLSRFKWWRSPRNLLSIVDNRLTAE